jgi:hypothetical protein
MYLDVLANQYQSCRHIMVAQTTNQAEPKPKPLAPIAVTFKNNSESFDGSMGTVSGLALGLVSQDV